MCEASHVGDIFNSSFIRACQGSQNFLDSLEIALYSMLFGHNILPTSLVPTKLWFYQSGEGEDRLCTLCCLGNSAG